VRENTNINPNTITYRFVIGKKYVMMFYKVEEDKFINFFSEGLLQTGEVRVTNNENGEYYPHSFYCQLDVESLALSVNINHTLIRYSFDQFDPFLNKMVEEITIQFCLRCIKAYDISKETDLLDTAEYILCKYYESSTYTNTSEIAAIVLLNQLQIKKRKLGSLEQADFENLIAIKSSFSLNDHYSLHFVCNVLLGSKTEADICFLKMDSENQDYFKTLPVYLLYSNME
jgi:hypothetical protein